MRGDACRAAARALKLAGLLGISSCSSGGEPPHEEPRDWTVLVYMAADNDLDPSAAQNLRELAEGAAAPGTQVIVQIDRHVRFATDSIVNLPPFSGTKRLRVESGHLRELADLGETNTADRHALADFVRWGFTEHPAARYALILWDHGAGWQGFGVDESEKPRARLALSDVRDAIAEGTQAAGVGRLAVLGFDACLMGTLEVAATLAPYADYLVASEELEPAHGWGYRSLASDAARSRSGADLGRALLAGYREKAVQRGTIDTITLSLVDLRRVEEVDQALVSFAARAEDDPVALTAVGRARAAALEFGASPEPRKGRHLVDLGDLASHVAASQPERARVARAVSSALREAVIEKVAGRAKAAATGLSVYFPPSLRDYNAAYDTLEAAAGWRSNVSTFFATARAMPQGASFSGESRRATISRSQSGLVVTGDLVKGSGNLVAESTLWLAPFDPDLLTIEIDADVDVDGVRATWDGRSVVARQGPVEDRPFFAASVVDEHLVVLTLPAVYSAAEETGREAVLEVVLEDGREVERSLFVTTADAVAEVHPAFGSRLVFGALRFKAGEDERWIPSSVSFDALAALELSFQRALDFPVRRAVLTVSDIAGRSDHVESIE